MSIKKSLIKNTSFNLAGYFYLLLASFFSISILLHNLGRNVFGVYIFLASFISLAATFDFGISTAVVRELSLPLTTKKEKTTVWKTSFAIFIALAGLVFASLLVILIYLTNSLPLFKEINKFTLDWTIAILSIIVFINHLNTHFLSLPQSEQRFDVFNSKTFLVGSANTIFSAITSYFYPNIAVIFFVQLVFHFLTTIYLVSYALKFFPGKDFLPEYISATGKRLSSFGLKNFVGTLAGQVEAQYSNFALGSLVSAQAVTAFSIPQSIVMKGAGVVSQFAQAFFPLSASLLAKERINKLKKLFIGVEGIILAGGALAVFLSYTVGNSFLSWWLKDAVVVAATTPILKVLSWYFVLVSLTPVPTALVQGLNKPQIASFFAVLTVTLEIITTLIFIPRYQALGVAYSFLLSSAISVPLFLITTWVIFQRQIKLLEESV